MEGGRSRRGKNKGRTDGRGGGGGGGGGSRGRGGGGGRHWHGICITLAGYLTSIGVSLTAHPRDNGITVHTSHEYKYK